MIESPSALGAAWPFPLRRKGPFWLACTSGILFLDKGGTHGKLDRGCPVSQRKPRVPCVAGPVVPGGNRPAPAARGRGGPALHVHPRPGERHGGSRDGPNQLRRRRQVAHRALSARCGTYVLQVSERTAIPGFARVSSMRL